MKAFLIDRKLSKEDIALIIKSASTHVYYFSSFSEAKDQLPFPASTLEIEDTEKKRINEEVTSKIIQFADYRLPGGARIGDRLIIDGANVFQYNKFRLVFNTRALYYKLHMIKQLSEKYEEVVFFTANAIFTSLSILPQNVKAKFTPRKKARKAYGSLIRFAILAIYRFMLGFFQKKRILKRKYLILARPENEQAFLSKSTLRHTAKNVYLSYLLDEADEDFGILEELIIPKITGKESFSFNRRFLRTASKKKSLFSEHILLRECLGSKVRKRVKKRLEVLTGRLEKAEKAVEGHFEKILLYQLKSLKKSNDLYLTKYYAYRNFFRRNAFSAFITVDEHSPQIRSIIDAAKYHQIKVIAIQHGTIHPFHPAYLFTSEDATRGVHPDLTLIWGKHWEKILREKGHYPEQKLALAGQIRTDIIPSLRKQHKQALIPEISEKRTLIVYASQPQRDKTLRERATRDVFRAAATTPKIHLAVKLHPREKDHSYFHSIAKEEGCHNYSLQDAVDLYQLIAASDGLITCFSTVGAETVYFHKPLIILDHLNQDIQGYIKAGVALQAVDSVTLEALIKKIAAQDFPLDKKAYSTFIRDYAYKIDGQVTKRCLERIKKL